MLLFIISFYLHYDLFNSEEINSAKFNESLLVDIYHRNVLEVNSLMKDLEHVLKEKMKLSVDKSENDTRRDIELASQYDIKDLVQNRTAGVEQTAKIKMDFTKIPNPYLAYKFRSSHSSLIAQPASPKFRSGLPFSEYLLSPSHVIDSEIMMPRSLLSVIGPGRYIARFTDPPRSIKTTSKKLQVPIYKARLHPEKPAVSLTTHNPALSWETPPKPTTPIPDMVGKGDIWLKEIAPYTSTRVHKRMKKATNGQIVLQRIEKSHPRIAKSRTGGPSTGTANTEQLFLENEQGLLYVSIAEHIPKESNKDTEMTTAGDVFYGKIDVYTPKTPIPNERYHEMMDRMEEGYLMLFLMEMSRLFAVKSKGEVANFLQHTEMVYNHLADSGRLKWIEEPLQTVITKLLMYPPGGDRDIDLIQARASVIFHMLLKRKEVLSPEMNSIIYHAEMLFNEDDGERLLKSLKEFEDHPNTNKTMSSICGDLIENLFNPFRRKPNTDRRQIILDSVNKVLKENFPTLKKRPRSGTATEEIPTIGTLSTQTEHRNSQKVVKKNAILKFTTRITNELPRFRGMTIKRFRPTRRWTTAAFLFLNHKMHAQRYLEQRL